MTAATPGYRLPPSARRGELHRHHRPRRGHGAVPGHRGWFGVRFVARFHSAATNPVATPLNSPTDLQAVALSDTQVELAWDENLANATGFDIERSSDSGSTFTQIGTTSADTTSYTDSTAVAGPPTFTKLATDEALHPLPARRRMPRPCRPLPNAAGAG